jgi:hypothetical protein
VFDAEEKVLAQGRVTGYGEWFIFDADEVVLG